MFILIFKYSLVAGYRSHDGAEEDTCNELLTGMNYTSQSNSCHKLSVNVASYPVKGGQCYKSLLFIITFLKALPCIPVFNMCNEMLVECLHYAEG